MAAVPAQPLAFVGMVSYGIYLWHYAAIELLGNRIGCDPANLGSAATICEPGTSNAFAKVAIGSIVLSIALGATTKKMLQGHHGANHPVKDHTTAKVEIVSMNHGFTVDRDSLPKGVVETHVSLFDGTNCGIALEGRPVFSVQHHPEASPGPQDSHYLFTRFVDHMRKAKA